MIVGASAGFVVLVALIVTTACVLRQRRNRLREQKYKVQKKTEEGLKLDRTVRDINLLLVDLRADVNANPVAIAEDAEEMNKDEAKTETV